MGMVETIFSDDSEIIDVLHARLDQLQESAKVLSAAARDTINPDLVSGELAALNACRLEFLNVVEGRLCEEPDPSHGYFLDERDPDDTYGDFISALQRLYAALTEEITVDHGLSKVESESRSLLLALGDLIGEVEFALQDYFGAIDSWTRGQVSDFEEWARISSEAADCATVETKDL